MTITNKVIDLKTEIKIKVLKASKTNGLKQRIISELEVISKTRELNKYETLNLLNAVERTQFYVSNNTCLGPVRSYKYRAFRKVEETPNNITYKVDIDNGKVILQGVII